MTNPLLFALPADLRLEDLFIESDTLTLLLASLQSHQVCPDCAHASARVHSRYSRRLADLPSQGRAVRLCLKVRRFFCENPACSRQTFAEQFPEVAPAYARRTLRQGKTLCEIAFALGGRAGARLACFLGLPVSFWTLLRLLRGTLPPHFTTPRVLGVDDFGATRKVACVAVRTLERRILPEVLPPSSLSERPLPRSLQPLQRSSSITTEAGATQ